MSDRSVDLGARASRAEATSDNTESELDVAGLFASHRKLLVRLAIVVVDDQETAEDVVQDVFLRFQTAAHRLTDPDAARAYLRASVLNRARSVLRRRRIMRIIARDQSSTVGGSESVNDEYVDLRRAVAKLPSRQQQVLALRYWADMSEAEIATILRVAPGTVKSAASRGVAKLRQMLLPEDGERR